MSGSAWGQGLAANLYSVLWGDRRGLKRIAVPGLRRSFELDGVCVFICSWISLGPRSPFLQRVNEGITIHSLGCRLGFRVNLGRRFSLGSPNRVFRASSLNNRRILGPDFIVFLLVFFDNRIAIRPPRTQLARRRSRRLVFFLENTRCSSSTLAGSAHR